MAFLLCFIIMLPTPNFEMFGLYYIFNTKLLNLIFSMCCIIALRKRILEVLNGIKFFAFTYFVHDFWFILTAGSF